MRTLGVLLRKELLESWRTYRLPVVVGLFALVGLSSPLLARFLPEIIEAAAGSTLGGLELPAPTAADAVDQLQKNLGQFGALAGILLAMGAIAGETERGTAAFILARPVTRGAFLGAKAIAIGLVLAVAVGVAVALGWVYTAILFDPPAVGGWIALAALSWLAISAWAAITFLASAVTGSAAAAAGLGLGALLAISIIAAIPGVGRWTPAGLAAPGSALALGTTSIADLGADLWAPIAATVVLIAVTLAVARSVFRRREL